MDTIRELEKQGYRFELSDGGIRFKYLGQGDPDPAIVKLLLEELKARKLEAIRYLESRQQASSKGSVVDLRTEAAKRVRPFPYPINETLGIGDCDPMDFKKVNDEWIHEPGWWRKRKKDKSKLL